FGGALVFAGAVPVDQGTCCAWAGDAAAPAAAAPIIANIVRRLRSLVDILSSRVIAVLATGRIGNSVITLSETHAALMPPPPHPPPRPPPPRPRPPPPPASAELAAAPGRVPPPAAPRPGPCTATAANTGPR